MANQTPLAIIRGNYYSNGAYGRSWGVRQVLELSQGTESPETLVTFRGIAGTCRRRQGICTLDEFRRWARHEVALNENSWQRVGYADEDRTEEENP